jgi:hypothetical protein
MKSAMHLADAASLPEQAVYSAQQLEKLIAALSDCRPNAEKCSECCG